MARYFIDVVFPVALPQVFKQVALVFFSQCEHHVVSASVLKITGRLKEGHGTAQRPPCELSQLWDESLSCTNLHSRRKSYLKVVYTKEAVRSEKEQGLQWATKVLRHFAILEYLRPIFPLNPTILPPPPKQCWISCIWSLLFS